MSDDLEKRLDDLERVVTAHGHDIDGIRKQADLDRRTIESGDKNNADTERDLSKSIEAIEKEIAAMKKKLKI
jgi:predicted  nucleic acid-binding Zn-ribbon protein